MDAELIPSANTNRYESLIASVMLLTCLSAVALTPIVTSLTVTLLLCMTLLLILSKRPILITSLQTSWPIALVFFSVLLIGYTLSKHAFTGGSIFGSLAKAILVGASVAVLARHAHWPLLTNGIVTISALLGLTSVILLISPSLSTAAVHWLDSIENMNAWGLSFALLMSVGISAALCSRGRVTLLMGVAIASTYLWLSTSYPCRGALLAVFCTLTLLILLRYSRVPVYAVFMGTCTAFVCGSFALLIIQQSGWVSTETLNNISSGRVPIYTIVWDQWLQAPWFGWGLKAFRSHAALMLAEQAQGSYFAWPHNFLLEMLYSFGLVGTSLSLAALGRITWLAMTAARDARNPLPGMLATALATTILLHGTTDLSIFRNYFFFTLLAAWGLTQANTQKPI